MSSTYSQLSLDERRLLDQLHHKRIPVAEIARILGRHRSTIYRELKRNQFVDREMPELNGYYCLTANDKARDRRARHIKLNRSTELRDAVIDRLKVGWSPEQIAGRLRLDQSDLKVSHETIYRYVYSKDVCEHDLYKHLPEHRRRRQPRNARRTRGVRHPDALALVNRPDIVSDRQEFGHWEGDLVMFRKEYGKANITTLVERKTHYTTLFHNNDRQSKPIMSQVVNEYSTLPHKARRSFTFDRGTEFAAWEELKNGLGSDVWFCNPHAPWQRGTNENTNRRLRRHLPRNTDPLSISQKHLQSIAELLNATPRKCLGYRTPSEAFRQELLEADI